MKSWLRPGWVELVEPIEDQVAGSVRYLESNESIRLRAWTAVGSPPPGQADELGLPR
jgi:hypothetical protein